MGNHPIEHNSNSRRDTFLGYDYYYYDGHDALTDSDKDAADAADAADALLLVGQVWVLQEILTGPLKVGDKQCIA